MAQITTTNTTTQVPAPPTTDPPVRPSRRRGVAVGWLFMASGLLAAGILLLVATFPGGTPEPVPTPNGSLVDLPRTPDISERWLAHHAEALASDGRYSGWPAGVPHSADAAERWFANQHQAPAGWPEGVTKSADAAERWFANQQQSPTSWPEGVPQSADAAERWFANQG